MVRLDVLGKRVRLSRLDLGLKQDALARRVGVSRSFLSLIENGHETDLKLGLVVSLARELQVSPAYVAGWDDDPLSGLAEMPDVMSAVGSLFPEFRPALEGFQRLDAETQGTILDTLHAVLALMVRLAERSRP